MFASRRFLGESMTKKLYELKKVLAVKTFFLFENEVYNFENNINQIKKRIHIIQKKSKLKNKSLNLCKISISQRIYIYYNSPQRMKNIKKPITLGNGKPFQSGFPLVPSKFENGNAYSNFNTNQKLFDKLFNCCRVQPASKYLSWILLQVIIKFVWKLVI